MLKKFGGYVFLSIHLANSSNQKTHSSMKKSLVLFVIMLSLNSGYSQYLKTVYSYSFEIAGVETKADAKIVTSDLIFIIGEDDIVYHSEEHKFHLKSQAFYKKESLIDLLEQNGYVVVK